jgi:hypothetical protein
MTSPDGPIEPTRRPRVTRDAETQTDIRRPDERAACRAWFDGGHAIAHEAGDRGGNQYAAAEKTIAEVGSRPDRESANNAAQLVAKTAASPEGLMRRGFQATILIARRRVRSAPCGCRFYTKRRQPNVPAESIKTSRGWWVTRFAVAR